MDRERIPSAYLYGCCILVRTSEVSTWSHRTGMAFGQHKPVEEAIMARVVKEHAVRRGEILDVAQRLVYTSGYEQMTIQDMLDELQISKGAFYHYFSSKQ